MEISKTKAAVYASLSSKKMRTKHAMFVAEGEKCALDTLDGYELVNLVATHDWIEGHKDIAAKHKDFILESSLETLKKISSLSTPPEVIAVLRLPKEEAIPDITSRLVLALDGIQDPGNLGTIIRTADWFGIDTILASKDTVDIYNPKVIQATMGSLKRVRVYYTSLLDVVRQYPTVPIFGTLLDGEDIFRSDLSERGIIVMGNEGNGVSEEMRKMITHPLLIPPYRKDCHGESLNVAIATAITLATFRNR